MTTNAKKTLWPVWLPGYLLCAAGFLLSVVAFYPGYMSPDSTGQLAQARAWEFTDWHPPLMAAVWGVVDRVAAGPAGMLLLHNAAYWGACALFWRATYRRSVWLGLGLVAFGFMPQVLSHLSAVWKDTGLGVSLLLASALLYRARETGSKGALVAALPLLFYGCGVRLNAAPAVLPLALWAGLIACRIFPTLRARSARWPRLLPALIGIACFLLLTGAATLVTEALIKGKHSYTGQTVLLHDLAAISIERGEALFPDYVVRDEHFSLDKVAQQYVPALATPIVGVETSGLKLSSDARDMDALRAKWLEVVPRNAGAYLRHRWAAFGWATGLGQPDVCLPYLIASTNPPGYKTGDLAVHRMLRAYFWTTRNTVFFRGFFWLLVCAALCYLASRGRLTGDLELVFVLATSGLLYGAAYFFIAPSCDFRFFWWTMLAASVASVFFLASALARLRESRRAARPKQ
ncbi:MAG TPA: hypothetical protein VEX60_17515 [Pyrinomonadaceae bacterium]|nr:hypothetical protein [Pyrinomonadaceae bacterium]